MSHDHNHALKRRRPAALASERTLPMSDPGLFLGPAETHAKRETENEVAARLDGFLLAHPFMPTELIQGALDVQKSLEKGQLKTAVNQLQAFINQVEAQSGKHITEDAANVLISDAQYVMAHPQ